MSMRDIVRPKDRFKANRGVRNVRVNSAGKAIITYTERQGYWKPATCADIHCHEYENGWISTVPKADPDRMEPARCDLINRMLADIYRMRNNLTWTFTKEVLENGAIRFTFPSGLTCFRHLDGTGHRIPVERDPRFVHRPSGRPGQADRAIDYDEFFDRFNESALRAQQTREKG